MVLGIVADENHATSWLDSRFPEIPQELPETLSVEPTGFAAEHESAVPQSNGGEVPHAVSRGVMIHDRILVFRGDPHAATRSLLLEVDLIQRPEIHGLVLHEPSEFFLCR